MNLANFIEESVVDGIGLRSVVFISGCKHDCKDCFSLQTHDFDFGEEFTLEKQLEIINIIKKNPLIDGITLSGGDPFFSAKEVVDFVRLVKKNLPHLNFWVYSGFTMKQLKKDPIKLELLKEIDVLVEGKFIKELHELDLRFKGSSNQKIIKAKESLEQNKMILWEE